MDRLRTSPASCRSACVLRPGLLPLEVMREMSAFLFYRQPVPLNRQAHARAKVRPVAGDYSFSHGVNSVPLAGREFVEASKEYPIVFSETGDQDVVPVVLLGVRSGKNLQLDGKSGWRSRYIPAFVRCYPFVLSSDRGNSGETLTLCVDESYPGFNGEEGEILFDGTGEYSPFLLNAVTFLRDCHAHFRITESFTAKLVQLSLLVPYAAKFDLAAGKSFTLGSFRIVDEKKLRELDGEAVVELFRAGWLAWIYFHLASLANLGPLLDLAAAETD